VEGATNIDARAKVSGPLKIHDWKPEEVKLPTAEEEAADVATGGYKRSDINGQLTARRARMDKMDVDKTACFAFMMKTVSEEYKEGIAKLDDYDAEIKNSRDPALLMEAFELTHHHHHQLNADDYQR